MNEDVERKYEVVELSPEMQKHLDFLEEFKKFVGLSDWTIILMVEPKDMTEYATTDANIFENTLEVTLSTKFMGVHEQAQRQILFHELVHGRHSVFTEKVEQLSQMEEELFINDIVRGFERLDVFDTKTI